MAQIASSPTLFDEIVGEMVKAAENLPAEHRKRMHLYFSKDLPFYTCVNEKGLWSKELKTGELYLVKREYIADGDRIEETVVKQLR